MSFLGTVDSSWGDMSIHENDPSEWHDGEVVLYPTSTLLPKLKVVDERGNTYDVGEWILQRGKEEGNEDRDVDAGDTRPWGEQQREIDWLESRFDGPEEYEPSVYDGTYSEE